MLALCLVVKNVQFRIVGSLWYSVRINITEAEPHSDSLHNGIVKPKNIKVGCENTVCIVGGCVGDVHKPC